MSNIQKTFDALQPYVVGIRYVEGVPVVDAVFKDGWSVPQEQLIKAVKADETLNYFIVYSEAQNIGIDELLAFVSKTIKLNQEREKKHELLRLKFDELKTLFKQNSLEKLNRLVFTFSEEDLVPKINEFDLNIEDEKPLMTSVEENFENEVIIVKDPDTFNGYSDEDATVSTINKVAYLDENGNPIEYSEEEMEMLEEEARAERNRKFLESKKPKRNSSKIELPPK